MYNKRTVIVNIEHTTKSGLSDKIIVSLKLL